MEKKKIDIDKILKENPNATVGDFKRDGEKLKYQHYQKRIILRSIRYLMQEKVLRIKPLKEGWSLYSTISKIDGI